MELFATITKSHQTLTISAKSSDLDVWKGFKYASGVSIFAISMQ